MNGTFIVKGSIENGTAGVGLGIFTFECLNWVDTWPTENPYKFMFAVKEGSLYKYIGMSY